MVASRVGGSVGVVFVSHSRAIAEGLVELARQMAPTVALQAAGGTDDGGIGTSFPRVKNAIENADSGAGVVVLYDLGSALLTTETAVEFLDSSQRQRLKIVDAPIVEGGLAAAVAAEIGEALDEVIAAAENAFTAPSSRGGAAAGTSGNSEDGYRRRVELCNKDGLHARPAADFVRLASSFGARVTVNGKDAKSLLSIMSLGLNRGDTAEIVSIDVGGSAAVDALVALIESGFAEE